MKIGIVGAGSIGLLFAAYLRDFFKVTLYTRSSLQAEEIKQHGLLLIREEEYLKKEVSAVPFSEWSGTEDLMIIAVKQYQLEEVIHTLNGSYKKNGSILFLQNGMGHLKLLPTVKFENIFIGSVEHGAYKENGYSVRHNGEGLTKTALYKGSKSILELLISEVNDPFRFMIEDSYIEMLGKKLIVNAVVNPLTALLKVPNGRLVENAYFMKMLYELFEEVALVLEVKEKKEQLKRIIDICKATASNRSSMLKDIEAARMTEADAILGYLMEEAARKNIQISLIKTFYYAIKGTEQEGED
jgi:2-dehydropantoate 2-reductase